MTDMVTMLLILGAGYYAYEEGMLDELVEQLKGVNIGGGEEAAPAEGGEAAPAEPAAAGGSCDCTCMPMDSDPSKFKIETAAGEDCYGNVYPASMAECETALKEVCAKRGGGGAAPAAPAEGGDKAAEGGGGDKAAESGGEDSEGGGDKKKKKSDYAISTYSTVPMNWV